MFTREQLNKLELVYGRAVRTGHARIAEDVRAYIMSGDPDLSCFGEAVATWNEWMDESI